MFNAQNRIRQLMAERGWTIYRLAQESGLSQTTISNIFKRNNQPSLPTVNAICDACGITLAQFFAEDDPANTLNTRSEFDNSVAALKEDQREALAAFIKTIVSTIPENIMRSLRQLLSQKRTSILGVLVL